MFKKIVILILLSISYVTQAQTALIIEAPADKPEIPITFGYLFSEGEYKETTLPCLTDATSHQFFTQVDVKTRHADGSAKFAILSSILSAKQGTNIYTLSPSQNKAKSRTSPQPNINDLDLNVILSDTKDKKWLLNISPTSAIKASSTWLNGEVVTEYEYISPFSDEHRNDHNELLAVVTIRHYHQIETTQVRLTLENSWPHSTQKQDKTYTIHATLNGQPLLAPLTVTHPPHARWTTSLSNDGQQQYQIKYQPKIFQQHKVVPTYDFGELDSRTIEKAKGYKASDKFDLLARGLMMADMGSTGERPEIGPLPRWQAWYLHTNNHDLQELTLHQATLSGSWPIHYRDPDTKQIISIDDYPRITIFGNDNDAKNRKKNRNEKIRGCSGKCSSRLKADTAHQPEFAFLPYLLTGDKYYLDELHFWANFNLVRQNPGYRGVSQGLVRKQQVRGQAWALRTLANAAYASPDDMWQKAYFSEKLRNNISWYIENYTKIDRDGLHWVHPISSELVASPWMDDFVTWSAGHIVNLGFTEAIPFRDWKARFAIERMLNTDYCWVSAAPYHLPVHKNKATPYKNFKEVYQALSLKFMPKLGKMLNEVPCGKTEMFDLISSKPNRIPGNYSMILQIALATAVDAELVNAQEAWDLFVQKTQHLERDQTAEYAVIPSN